MPRRKTPRRKKKQLPVYVDLGSDDLSLAVLAFKLPEAKAEHTAALCGMDLALNLSQVDEALRARIKYSSLGEEAERELQAIRDLIDRQMLDRVLF